jgi:hypothetical protein
MQQRLEQKNRATQAEPINIENFAPHFRGRNPETGPFSTVEVLSAWNKKVQWSYKAVHKEALHKYLTN